MMSNDGEHDQRRINLAVPGGVDSVGANYVDDVAGAFGVDRNSLADIFNTFR